MVILNAIQVKNPFINILDVIQNTSMQKYAKYAKYAKICKNMQKYAKICKPHKSFMI